MNNLRDNKSFYRFNDRDREIVFLRHDMPSPWMNYLTNGKLFTMMSQAGGNLSWYKSPEIWRIGRYNFYNLPVDVCGMFIYVKDLETGEVWNPSFIPTDNAPDSWESAHGLGYTRFKASKDGVTINLTCFIGKDDVLIYKMSVESVLDKKIQIFACQEMGLMQYLKEVQWQCYCKNSNNILYNKDLDCLVYEYFIDMQPRPDETPFVYFTSDRRSSSYSGVRQSFIGYYRDLKNPIALENGSCGNTELKGGEAMFSMSFDLELSKNKPENINLFLGTVVNQEELPQILSDIRKENYTDESFAWLKNYWEERLSVFQVQISDKNAERMINTWNPLQVLVNFYVCREISFYATGTIRGVGVRDASQDILANVMYDLNASKEKLKLILTQQYNSGKTNHYFYPVELNPPIVSDRSDNHLWMIYAVYQLIIEEGKLDILDEIVPYYDGGEGTVLEHLEKSIYYTVNNLGKDGLPLMLGSDWNDMLSNVCKKGYGESVFVSEMLVLACRELKEIYTLIGKDYTDLDNIAQKQIELINTFCWDGDWFIRAVTDEGMKLGKKTDKCAKIWINSQSWAVYSGATDEEKGKKAMQSCMDILDCGYGLLKLYPPLQRNYPSKENELTFAQPGIGENGGVFCHANTWAIIANCILGNNESAYKIYKDLIPHNIVEKFGVDYYNAEPYIYSSNIRGPMALMGGTAGVSWLSGTATWMMMALSEYIFGVKPTFNGLKIKPCIPNEWEKVTLNRKFRGTNYVINIDNSAKCGNKVKEILVNGKVFNGEIISSKEKQVDITVIMG